MKSIQHCVRFGTSLYARIQKYQEETGRRSFAEAVLWLCEHALKNLER